MTKQEASALRAMLYRIRNRYTAIYSMIEDNVEQSIIDSARLEIDSLIMTTDLLLITWNDDERK